MPRYVYRCDNDHRIEVEHGMLTFIEVYCWECNKKMSRVPQPFRFGFAAIDVLYDKMDREWREWRARDKAKKRRLGNARTN